MEEMSDDQTREARKKESVSPTAQYPATSVSAAMGRLSAVSTAVGPAEKCIYRVQRTRPQDAYGRYDNGEGGFGSLFP